MNCNSCNTPLKKGAKFCTGCGAKQEQIAEDCCKECNKLLKPDAKFCTGCGTKVDIAAVETPIVTEETPLVETEIDDKKADRFSIVKQKLVWNIQKGEVARVISEEEFANYSEVTGLIINEGTKALIRLNGEVIAEINSGVYNFVDLDALEKDLKLTNIALPLKRGLNFIANLFRTSQTKIDPQTNLGTFISKLQKGDVFSIVLTLDVPITLLFGKEQENIDDYSTFEPMKVRAKNLDIEVGLRAQFKITNIREFAKQYLYSQTSVTTSMIVANSIHTISTCVREVIAEFDIENDVIPQACIEAIDQRIKSQNSEILAGISLLRIVEVSLSSEDLERFRNLNQELYLTQREMEYLQRTNDFKNRLTDIENEQSIHEAQNDLDLNKRLQAINKDKLLNEEELDKFYMLLSRERKIREAQNENEIAAALHDIEKTGLIRKEDLDVLKSQIEADTHKRGFALEMMRLKDSITYEHTLKSAEIEMETNFVKAEIEQTRLKDDYQDERFDKRLNQEAEARKVALDLKRQEEEQNLDMEDRRSNRQMDDFMRMAELKQNMQASEHSREMDKVRTEQAQEQEMQRLKTEQQIKMREASQNLTSEQMMAMAANENLDAEAAREFAHSFSTGRDAQAMRENADKMDQVQQARVDDLKDMMRTMMDHNQAVTSSLAHSKEESKNEYKERLAVEQQRLDRTQDAALNYTTRNNIGTSNNNVAPPAPSQPSANCCQKCSNENASGSRFCEYCGNEM